MEKNFRRLIQMSLLRRNSVILSNYRVVLYKTPQKFFSCSQDALPLSRETKPYEKKTEKFNKLNLSDDYLTILQKHKDNYEKMDGKITIQILSDLVRAIKDKNSPIDIKRNESFSQLCSAINENIRNFSIPELIDLLKMLTYLRVSSQSLLLNTVFQLLTVRVNEISVFHIPFLHFLLRRQEKQIPLVKALLAALPIVFANEFKRQAELANIKSLETMFRFACYNCNQSIISTIAKAIMKSAYYTSIDVPEAKSIYLTICKLDVIPITCLKLLSIVQNIIIARANNLSHVEIHELFKAIDKKVKGQQSEFYSIDLIDALVSVFLTFNPDVSSSYDILEKLNNLNYGHIPLLDHFAEQCFGESHFQTVYPFHIVESTVKALTLVNRKPVLWNKIQDIICNNQFSATSFTIRIVHFVLNAISLDCYHPHLVNMAFQASILESAEKITDVEKHKLLLLYQSIKTLYPEYDGPWPSTSILQQAQAFDHIFENESLNNALEWAVGGVQFIRRSLRTKLGHFIDHVIVMEPEGQPVVINSDKDADKNTEFIEDMQLPLNSRMVLIFIFPTTAYSINDQHLKSTRYLELRSVKKLMGCSTIAINSGLWNDLPEREKIPYLKRAIRLTCDDKPICRICQYV